MTQENLRKYGFTPFFEREAAGWGDLLPARVTEQHRELYRIVGEEGEGLASVSGRFAYGARDERDYPAVGDWVLVDRIGGIGGNGDGGDGARDGSGGDGDDARGRDDGSGGGSDERARAGSGAGSGGGEARPRADGAAG
jgi:hypothetical protein